MARDSLSRRSRRSRDEDDEFDPTPDESQDIGRYDDDDDEPPRRRRGRSRRDDDDEDEAPRRRSHRSRDDEEPRSRRSRDDDDDEDEEPRSRRSSRSSERPSGNSSGKGWKAFKQKREERSDYVKTYKLPEKEAEIIKILDDEPFTVYAEHWLDERSGKKSFVCIGDDCPLCDVGDKPRVYAMFNVADLRDPEDPTVVPWKVSQTVADVLQGYAEDKKTSPINRDDLYFSVKKTGGGKKGRVQTNLSPVKARDLLEDWDIEPFTAAELAKFDRFEEDDVLEFYSRTDLKKIARDLDD